MAQMTAHHVHEKRAKFEAAPAASIAGDVGRRVDRTATNIALEKAFFNYDVKSLRVLRKEHLLTFYRLEHVLR